MKVVVQCTLIRSPLFKQLIATEVSYQPPALNDNHTRLLHYAYNRFSISPRLDGLQMER